MPALFEILTILTEGRDLEDISFEIDDIGYCNECYENENVCRLWVSLAFVEDMKPQMGISDGRVTIDTLEEQLAKIVMQLLHDIKKMKSNNNT